MPWARDASRRALDAVPRSASARSLGDVRSRHPRRLTRVAASLLAVALALGMTVAASATANAAPRIAGSVPAEERIESSDCPVDVPSEYADRVSCSVLVVPERRTAESDPLKTISLPVAVIASRNPDPERDPLVFPTSGGPGGGTLGSLWYFLEYADWALDDRDIILMEQRGDALSEPSLNCPELDVEHFVEDGVLLTGDAASERGTTQLQACYDRLIADGIDLGAYTSAESVADLVDLRAALDYDAWNLYGISYGSRLAMTVMRDQPEGLRSVIMDGPLPPNVNRFETLPAGFLSALDALFAHCAADAACDASYPELEQDLARVLAGAAETPIPVVVKNPADGSPLRLEVSDTDLARGLFDALYDPELVRALPFLIDRLESGDAAPILPLAQRSLDFRDYFTEGLGMSVECAEEVPFNDEALMAEALTADPLPRALLRH